MNAECCLGHAQTECSGDAFLQHFLRSILVEQHVAAQEVAGVEIAQNQVGVGHGRIGTTLAIAGRSGNSAGTVRTDLDQAHLVDARDAAAAGANLDHVERGHLERDTAAFLEAAQACDFEVGRDGRFALVDQAGLGGRASHVEAQDVFRIGQPAYQRRGLHATGRTGLHQANRVFEGGAVVGRATVGLHQVQILADAHALEPVNQAGGVLAEQGLHVGIADRRGGALVLTNLGHDLA